MLAAISKIGHANRHVPSEYRWCAIHIILLYCTVLYDGSIAIVIFIVMAICKLVVTQPVAFEYCT